MATLEQVVKKRRHMLVWTGTSIDDIGRILEAFELRAIPKQRVLTLQPRDQGLADAGIGTAEKVFDSLSDHCRRSGGRMAGI